MSDPKVPDLEKQQGEEDLTAEQAEAAQGGNANIASMDFVSRKAGGDPTSAGLSQTTVFDP